MLIFEPKNRPSHVPVLVETLLSPWFSSEMLARGLELLKKERFSHFHVFRQAVGTIINSENIVTLQYESSKKLRQGFTFRTGNCSCCPTASARKGCIHLAALALLSLIDIDGTPRPTPLPPAFTGSTWETIGHLLHDWLGSRTWKAELSSRSLSITADDGSLTARIPRFWHEQCSLLLSRGNRGGTDWRQAKIFNLLTEQLQVLCLTETERTLREAGSRSSGWNRDQSLWMWLAHALFCSHGNTLPQLRRNATDSAFELSLKHEEGQDSLTISLPLGRAWELVRRIDFTDPETAVLPKARECSRAFFDSTDQLVIEPCLRLDGGQILSRQELAEHRFAGGFYLDGQGFLPTIRQPAEGTFRSPSAQAAMPLLGFVEGESRRDLPFTVKADDIPGFLKANHRALRHPDNIIAPELLDFEIKTLPDRLIIDAFEEVDGWCYLSCRYGLGNTTISLDDIREARKAKRGCLAGRHWLELDKTPLAWLYDLPEERFSGDDSGTFRLTMAEMVALTAIVGQSEMTDSSTSSPVKVSRLLEAAHRLDDSVAESAPAHLRAYQRNGLAWLKGLSDYGLGGILADDMGLGKTHQALALLLLTEQPAGPRLIICPASVILNWADKIDSYYPMLNYRLYYGQKRNPDILEDADILLTTFGIVRQDHRLLLEQCFDTIIIDEIQHIKNPATAIHQAVATLNGRVKIGLTGTPIENSLMDLHSLFGVCLPGYLGSRRHFERIYAQPIAAAKHSRTEEVLRRLVDPFILRRTRRQVLTELPDIILDDRVCELSDDQVALYRQVIADRQEVMDELRDSTSTIPYINVLAMITRLKQICNHPCLVQKDDDPAAYASGKWDLFLELAGELLDAGMKFVVFSQYTSMLELIERHLDRQGVGFGSLKGSMPVSKRQKMITRFNNDADCRVFCASLLAGGTGIDLTAAQAVIHYDRWWNPAREEQATARVHRMGQKRVVQVFRLLTRGTLEEKIHRLITGKNELSSAIIQEDEAGIIKQMDREQLAELFRFTPNGKR